MPTRLHVAEFLHTPGLLLDTRSPGEYAQGRIPGAVNLPLFTNDERAAVGTCYKQEGQEQAVELGLAIVGPKLLSLVQTAKTLAPDHRVRLHCWRGGMRSSSMAWLLETAGMDVTLLINGYKGFRRWVSTTLTTPQQIVTLGGMTGSGKTELLAALADRGEQILDLEQLAHHRGSSYGALGLPTQPNDEQFHNEIALIWQHFDPTRPVWIEAESRRIGLCRVPDAIFIPMSQAPVVQVERSRVDRINLLQTAYGHIDPADLITATARLTRKLGGQHAQTAIAHIQQGNLAAAIDIVLNYYDKTYCYDLQRRKVPVYPVAVAADESPEQIVTRLMATAATIELGLVKRHPAATTARSSDSVG
jgi:tRNA 2-selenouridine synthase